ncbi:MAG: hypothetical protein ABEI99_04575 [Halobaculum sp.]
MARDTTADENRTETDDTETVADGGRVTDRRGTQDPAKALLEDAAGL